MMFPNEDRFVEHCRSYIGKKFGITASFDDENSEKIVNHNIIGDILENLMYPVYRRCIHIVQGPRQQPPDFIAYDDWFIEQKSFLGSPGFDISNFASFVKQLAEEGGVIRKIFKTKYIIYEYKFLEQENKYEIENFWFLNVWQLPQYGGLRPISIQSKHGHWYNIRPGSCSGWNDNRKTAQVFFDKLFECIDTCPNLTNRDELKNSINRQIEEARTQGYL